MAQCTNRFSRGRSSRQICTQKCSVNQPLGTRHGPGLAPMHPLPRSEPAHSPAGPSAGLIQCERTLCVRRGQVAEHGRTPAVAARMPPAVLLLIHLRIGTAAGCCCCSSSSLLLPHSVKPAAQRGVQNSRGFGYLLRLSAFRPGDRSWMVRWSSLSSIEPSQHLLAARGRVVHVHVLRHRQGEYMSR